MARDIIFGLAGDIQECLPCRQCHSVKKLVRYFETSDLSAEASRLISYYKSKKKAWNPEEHKGLILWHYSQYFCLNNDCRTSEWNNSIGMTDEEATSRARLKWNERNTI